MHVTLEQCCKTHILCATYFTNFTTSGANMLFLVYYLVQQAKNAKIKAAKIV